jgi:hypothetical protein
MQAWVSLKLMSSEIIKTGCADGVRSSGRQHGGTRNRERVPGTAESQTPGMYGNFTRGNREALLLSVAAGRRNGGRKR